ncbi:MAG TPA: LapA family protein [Pseudidiomarina sp.]|nr:LapA family protein [Pseudidiomarina sp.]
MLRFVFVILPVVVLFLLAVAFGALNKNVIEVDFIVLQSELPLAVITAIFLVLGFVIGVGGLLSRNWWLHRENRKLKKQLAKFQPETTSTAAERP